jgi:hypothetical protein
MRKAIEENTMNRPPPFTVKHDDELCLTKTHD